MAKNYYEILRVAPDVDAETIKSAYRRLAQIYHPDKRTNKKFANHKFKSIGEAYAVLSDSDKRSEYDQTIDASKEGKAKQAKAEQAKAEQAKAEQAKAEQAKAEQAKAEQATERTSGRRRGPGARHSVGSKTEQATERTSGRPCFICWIVWLMICFLLAWFDFWSWLGRLVGL
ncbi:MAG: J domain-containing protein [Gammaproteobacteria bacterium]|nr:J domain-containing protein [Gammaproteobacteria bacterium]